MSPKIFISHSAKDPEAETILWELAQKLTDKSFDVFVDRERLEPGTYWRDTINTWLGECDGAILLVSPDAITSDFVRREATILAHRHQFETNFAGAKFPFLPVYIGGTKPSDLKSVSILPLDDIQSVLEPGGTLQERAAEVVQEALDFFAPLMRGVEAAQGKDICREIIALLPDTDDFGTSLELLGADPKRLPRGRDARRRAFANYLLAARLEQAARALLKIPQAYWTRQSHREEVIHWLAPTWVEARSVSWLLDRFSKFPPTQAVIISTEILLSLKCHLERARWRLEDGNIIRVYVDAPTEGDAVAIVRDYAQKFLNEYMSDFIDGIPLSRRSDLEGNIKQHIADSAELGIHYVFVFQRRGDYDYLAREMMKTFGPFHCIIMERRDTTLDAGELSSEAQSDSNSSGLPPVAMAPNVDMDAERVYLKDYKAAMGRLKIFEARRDQRAY